MKIKNILKNNQSGMASMVIVILIMTILTLIVVAMTQNSNREQRQGLDRQLNSQALYAAESGITDAKDYVTEPPTGTIPPDDKKTCEPLAGANPGDQFPGKSSQVGSDEVIRYSCVLYDRYPDSLIIDNVGTGSSEILPIEDDDGSVIESLTFTWKKNQGGSGTTATGEINVHVFGGCHNASQRLVLPSVWPAECDAGMVRVELMDPEAANRQDFLQNIYLGYFKPTSDGAGTGLFANGQGVNYQGELINGKCNDNDDCEVTITNVNSPKLYMNARSLYMPNSFTVTGQTSSGPLEFKNAQMSVDSTGRANDILKRVSVRVPLSGLEGSLITPFAIQTSDDLCKQLQLRPGKPTPVIDDC